MHKKEKYHTIGLKILTTLKMDLFIFTVIESLPCNFKIVSKIVKAKNSFIFFKWKVRFSSHPILGPEELRETVHNCKFHNKRIVSPDDLTKRKIKKRPTGRWDVKNVIEKTRAKTSSEKESYVTYGSLTLIALFEKTIKLIGFTPKPIKALSIHRPSKHIRVAPLKRYLSDFWLSALLIFRYYYVLQSSSLHFIKTYKTLQIYLFFFKC